MFRLLKRIKTPENERWQGFTSSCLKIAANKGLRQLGFNVPRECRDHAAASSSETSLRTHTGHAAHSEL